MKNIIIFGFLALGILAACSNNDECVQADYLGTWIGTESCNSSFPTDITISFTAEGNDKLIMDGAIFSTPLNVNVCNIEAKDISNPEIGWEYTGSLSGDNLKVKYSSYGGFVGDYTCDYELVRQ